MIIYKTTNLVNGKIYIGQDSKNNPEYIGSGVYFTRAIKKHGKHNFIKEILCKCTSSQEMDQKEIEFIEKFDSCNPRIGYNLAKGGKTTLGLKMTLEQRQRNRQRNLGHLNPNFGKKHSVAAILKMKAKKSGINNPNFGKSCSIEQRRKISESQKGEKCKFYRVKFDQEKIEKWKTAQISNSFPVIQLDPVTSTLLFKWPSIAEAARATGVSSSSIRDVCRGDRKSTQGMFFAYQ